MHSQARDLPAILQGLDAIVIGTRDAALSPACTLAAGVAADSAGRVTVYVPEASGAAVLANVAANGRVAVVLEHIPTHRTVQVKGSCLEMRPAREDERAIVARCQEGFFGQVALHGAPHQVRRRVSWPCRAITFEAQEIYEQTPGPRAGLPLEAARP